MIRIRKKIARIDNTSNFQEEQKCSCRLQFQLRLVPSRMWTRSSQVTRASCCHCHYHISSGLPFQHPPIQWNLRGRQMKQYWTKVACASKNPCFKKAKKIGICIKMAWIHNNGKLYILVWSQSCSYWSCISSKDPDSHQNGLDPQHWHSANSWRTDYIHSKSSYPTNIWSGSTSKRFGSNADMRRSAESWMQTWVNHPNLEEPIMLLPKL